MKQQDRRQDRRCILPSFRFPFDVSHADAANGHVTVLVSHHLLNAHDRFHILASISETRVSIGTALCTVKQRRPEATRPHVARHYPNCCSIPVSILRNSCIVPSDTKR